MSTPDKPKPQFTQRQQDEALGQKRAIEQFMGNLVTMTDRPLRETLSYMLETAASIERTAARYPAFEQYVDELIEGFDGILKEGLPKYQQYFREFLEREERYSRVEQSEDDENREQIPDRAQRLKGLNELIQELDGLIALKKEAFEEDFGPLLKKARELRRPLAVLELQGYQRRAETIAKFDDQAEKKDRFLRLVLQVRKDLQSVAEDDETFRQCHYDRVISLIQGMRVTAIDTLIDPMKIRAKPPTRRGCLKPTIGFALTIIAVALASGHFQGMRPQDLWNFLKDLMPSLPSTAPAVPIPPAKTSIPDTAPARSTSTATPDSATTAVPGSATVGPERSSEPSGPTPDQVREREAAEQARLRQQQEAERIRREQEQSAREAEERAQRERAERERAETEQRLAAARAAIRGEYRQTLQQTEARLSELRAQLQGDQARLQQWRDYQGSDQERRARNIASGERRVAEKEEQIRLLEADVVLYNAVLQIPDSELQQALTAAQAQTDSARRAELLRKLLNPHQ